MKDNAIPLHLESLKEFYFLSYALKAAGYIFSFLAYKISRALLDYFSQHFLNHLFLMESQNFFLFLHDLIQLLHYIESIYYPFYC